MSLKSSTNKVRSSLGGFEEFSNLRGCSAVDGERDLVKISVKIPAWMKNWIERKAEEECESESVIIRRLLRKGIRTEGGDQT